GGGPRGRAGCGSGPGVVAGESLPLPAPGGAVRPPNRATREWFARGSVVVVGQIVELPSGSEAVPGVLRLRRSERAALERLPERCLDLAGLAFDSSAMEQPRLFDFRRRPPGKLLEVEADVDGRS